MNAGIAIRTIPASFWLKMGNVQWIEASPLTIWKAQPRTFAWEYLPFEVEQPIARYYEYNIAKGEKTGRAAWNKKPFNGINLESINLPANLYLNLLYGTFERFDNFEREYIDFANDGVYAGASGVDIKNGGIGDSYRKIFHGRFAAKKFYKDLTLGANFNSLMYSDDVIYAKGYGNPQIFQFTKAFRIDSGLSDRGFYKEPRILSLDLRGPLNDKFRMHTDLGASWVDTTWLIADTTGGVSEYEAIKIKEKKTTKSGIKPAVYSNLEWNGKLPVAADLAFIGKGFYSPHSFAVPMDAFYAFGTNMIGAGKFAARGEGSPYAQNMAGIQLKVEPKLSGYGHLRIKYGQHFQLESARDLLFFPYRLNGQDFSSFFHSSFARWANGEVDEGFPDPYYDFDGKKYQSRLGDESYNYAQSYKNPDGPASGGIKTDFLSTYESFVAYEDSLSAALNSGRVTNVYDRDSSYVPHHRKFTFNLDADIGYDIGPLVGYSRDFFLGGYASISGVSTTFKPLSFNDEGEDMLLWSLYLRLEPAIAVSERLYLIGLAGFENWRSKKAYMNTEAEDGGINIKHVPIDYRDLAFGIGMDWDMLERVGFHLRAKRMIHIDNEFRENDWKTWVVSSEMKMWF
ncbi:MAG: hypothetical protein ACLFSB_02005 [Chitinispirillaceae bacterium]